MPINVIAWLYPPVVFLKTYLLQLNLFNTGTQNEQTIKNERRSTRLYLLLLIISMVILTFYYTITPFTKTIIIESPSFDKYSTLVHQSSLQCPCSNIAVKYDQFIHIEPFYHELCQSDFISNDWINHLFSLYKQCWNNSIASDFCRIAVFQFQTIRSLCQLAEETIKNSLQSFKEKEFIQSQLISSEQFQGQINSFIAEFIDSISKIFLRTLQFVQNTTAQSLLMTGGSMTSVLPSDRLSFEGQLEVNVFPGMVYTFSDDSTCICSSSTSTSCMGTAIFRNETVPGFQTGCYMMSALLKSTLQTLYNQSFIDMITDSSKNFQKLNSSVSNRTIEMLLSEMFVDHWLNTTSYEHYFNACKPDLCQYTVSQRYDFLHILTLMIGLFGGLSSALTIIAPFIIVIIWPTARKLVTRKRTPVIQLVAVEDIREPTISDRLKKMFQFLKRTMIELNLFKSIPPSQDPNVIRQQRYSTRVYLILLFTAMSILTLFTSLRMQTISVTIKMPTSTEFIQLYDRYSLTLNCPCTHTTIKYNDLMLNIKPQYHQVCSSEFVSPNWINVEFVKSPSERILGIDIRSQSQIHFQLLSTLCHAANQTIEDNLQLFLKTKFVSHQVLSPDSFRIQIDLIVEQFKRTVPESFQRTLILIQAISEMNQYIVPINSIFSGPITFNGSLLEHKSQFYSDRPNCSESTSKDCICYTLSIKECYLKTRIIDNETQHIIPGMFYTWFPLQSLLMSTLECLYDDSCLSQINAFINATVSSTNFTILNLLSESDTNNSYDQIEVLANRLFIQSWNNDSSFESYFNHCYPLTCQYTYKSQLSLIYMITTIIGLIGGLTVVSRLLAPLIVKLAPKIWNYVTHRQRDDVVLAAESTLVRSGFCGRFCSFVKFIARNVIELNLFSSIPPSQDPKIVRRNRRTTRVYLISLIIAMVIILIYTSLRRDTITVIVDSPSVLKYTQLYTQYPVTLKCPCSRIIVKYDKFIPQIEPQYHQVCSSDFISSEWIESLQPSRNYLHEKFVYENDFRATARLQFLTISKFCALSQKTVNLSLSIFRQKDFITARVIPRTEFSVQIEALIEQFKRTTTDEFMQIFKLIQATNLGNQLATAFSSNWDFIMKYQFGESPPLDDPSSLPALTREKTYGTDNCSCAIQSNCTKLSDFPMRTSNQSLRQTLQGFRIGCLPLDALLQSSLSCLYNQSCLDLMRTAIYYSKPVPVEILKYSSSMDPNTTIENILSQLFVSKWFHHFSFDRYFNECAPQSCQYSYSTKFNRIYVVTTLIALFGGLTDGLHFVVSCISLLVFKLYDYLKKKKNNVVAPHSQQSNIVAIDTENNALETVSMPTIVTEQFTVDPIDQQTEPRIRRTEQAYLACLSLLIIVVIVVASVVWFIGAKNNDYKIMLSSTLTTPTTSNIGTESTTKLTRTCHMILKFQSQTYLTGVDSKSLIINDFNGDSILDLAVTNYGDDTFSILLGNGNGTFQTQLLYSTGNTTRPWGIATADFNNDTLLDLAIILSETNKVVIFYGVATNLLFNLSPNTLTDHVSFTNIRGAVEAADLNADGLIDLVVSNQMMPDDLQSMAPSLVIFNLGGKHQFEVKSLFHMFSNYVLITIGDFDNDGKNDGICACNSDGIVHILEQIDYHIGYPRRFEVNYMYGQLSSLTKGRFNDDEFEDLAVISSDTDTLQILLAYEDATFTQQIYPTENYPTSVTRINFNNDQIDDLAVLTCNRTVTVFLGTPIGIFDRNYLSFDTNNRKSDQCAHSLKVADLNRDGRDDLVFIDTGTQSIGVLLGKNCHE